MFDDANRMGALAIDLVQQGCTFFVASVNRSDQCDAIDGGRTGSVNGLRLHGACMVPAWRRAVDPPGAAG